MRVMSGPVPERSDMVDKQGEDLRRILNLRIVRGYSVAKTASALGKSEAEVYGGQYRALYSLARLLAQGNV